MPLLGMSGVLMRHLCRDADDESVRRRSGAAEIRVFQAGTDAVYAFEIYDGLDAEEPIGTTTAPLRDGREVYRSAASRISSGRRRHRFNCIPIGGTLALGPKPVARAYLLQVDVGRLGRGQLDVIATQWPDFEVQER